MFENASRDKIAVSYRKMLDCQTKINNIYDNVNETMTTMMSLLGENSRVLSHWLGPARNAFNEKYKDSVDALLKMNGQQKKNADAIGQIVTLYQNNESDIVKEVSMLEDLTDIFAE